MYTAIDPLYRKLHEILQQRFAKRHFEGQNPFSDAENLFKHIDLGMRVFSKHRDSLVECPYGCLEWGTTGRVEGYRMPETYRYELRLPFLIVTAEDTVRVESQTVFSADSEGVADIIRRVGSFFFQNYHTGRFTEAVTPASADEWSWSIINWTQRIQNPLMTSDDPDSIAITRFQELLRDNPLLRGAQMNFYFEIEERKPLGNLYD